MILPVGTLPQLGFTGEMLMVASASEGVGLFKIAGRSISGWVPSLKTYTVIRQPFCSQLEERLFCRIAGHTSEEVRGILATLEKEYQQLLRQLNLRQWTSSIYTWLTHPVLDPTRLGRGTMDNLMKLVLTALEWSYLDGKTDVVPSRLKSAAELLVLRHDTLKLIDGAGPDALAPTQNKRDVPGANGKELQQQTVPGNELRDPSQQRETAKEQEPSPKTTNCTFSGEPVSINLKQFTESGISLVECPHCGRMRSLSPLKGVLRFKPRTRRRQQTPLTEKRWSSSGKQTGTWLEGNDTRPRTGEARLAR
jgi:hypothetical protein